MLLPNWFQTIIYNKTIYQKKKEAQYIELDVHVHNANQTFKVFARQVVKLQFNIAFFKFIL